MTNIKFDYTPTEKQQIFHSSGADEVLYGGAAGGGKTVALIAEAFKLAMQTPGMVIYFFRRKYRELEDTVIPIALNMYPSELADYHVQRKEFLLHNAVGPRLGSVIRFRHCEHEIDAFSYKSTEMHAAMFDELTQFTESMYQNITTRVRAAIALGVTAYIRCGSNPGEIGNKWVEDYFIKGGNPYEIRYIKVYITRADLQKFLQDPAYIGKIYREVDKDGTERFYVIRTRQFIPSTLFDNPHLGADYLANLKTKDEKTQRMLIYGDWQCFEGQVFTEWRNDPEHYRDRLWTHVIEPFPIPQHWRIFPSFDWGYASPFSLLYWAVDPDGKVYLIREFYGADSKGKGLKWTSQRIAETHKTICTEKWQPPRGDFNDDAFAAYKRYTFGDYTVQRITADPSIFDGGEESPAAIMHKAGARFNDPRYDKQYRVINARIPGKLQFHNRLDFDENGIPGMYVFSTCENFIEHIPQLVYSESDPEDVNTDGDDHDYDAARYFFMSRKMKPKVDIKKVIRSWNPLAG